jgi:hypothetical protein
MGGRGNVAWRSFFLLHSRLLTHCQPDDIARCSQHYVDNSFCDTNESFSFSFTFCKASIILFCLLVKRRSS